MNPSDLKDYETNKSAKLANGVTMSHWVRATPRDCFTKKSDRSSETMILYYIFRKNLSEVSKAARLKKRKKIFDTLYVLDDDSVTIVLRTNSIREKNLFLDI